MSDTSLFATENALGLGVVPQEVALAARQFVHSGILLRHIKILLRHIKKEIRLLDSIALRIEGPSQYNVTPNQRFFSSALALERGGNLSDAVL